MSDPQTRYINAYIDHAMGMLHEQLAQLLQTKSHLRVANEIVAEKDNIIRNLQNELEQCKSNVGEKTILAENAKKMEVDYNALKNKVSHLESLMHQVGDMKKTIIEKDAAYSAMVGQKEAAYNNMVAEKDSKYKKDIAEKEESYKKALLEKEEAIQKLIDEKQEVINSKNQEIEELKNKIIELQSPEKTINREEPIEVLESIVEEAPTVLSDELPEEPPTTLPVEAPEEVTTVLPVVLPTVDNQQPRETDDF